jgi:hypothetical protein
MKHLLNDLSNEEKNRIREQYEGGMSVDNSRFKKLMESKLGNVKPLISEDLSSLMKDISTTLGNDIENNKSLDCESLKPTIKNILSNLDENEEDKPMITTVCTSDEPIKMLKSALSILSTSNQGEDEYIDNKIIECVKTAIKEYCDARPQ